MLGVTAYVLQFITNLKQRPKKNICGLFTYKKMFLLANSMSNSNKIWDLSLLMMLLDVKEDW